MEPLELLRLRLELLRMQLSEPIASETVGEFVCVSVIGGHMQIILQMQSIHFHDLLKAQVGLTNKTRMLCHQTCLIKSNQSCKRCTLGRFPQKKPPLYLKRSGVYVLAKMARISTTECLAQQKGYLVLFKRLLVFMLAIIILPSLRNITWNIGRTAISKSTGRGCTMVRQWNYFFH